MPGERGKIAAPIPKQDEKAKEVGIQQAEVKNPYESPEAKDVAIRGIKDEAGAREVLGRLDAEKDTLAKKMVDGVGKLSADERHSIANKMAMLKTDSAEIARKHGVKDYVSKYQGDAEGMDRTELSPETQEKLKGYRPVVITKSDGSSEPARR